MLIYLYSYDNELFSNENIKDIKVGSVFQAKMHHEIYKSREDFIKNNGPALDRQGFNRNHFLGEVEPINYIFRTNNNYKLKSVQRIKEEEVKKEYKNLPTSERYLYYYWHEELEELKPEEFLEIAKNSYKKEAQVIESDKFIFHETGHDPYLTGLAYIQFIYNAEEESREKTANGNLVKYRKKDKSKDSYVVISDSRQNFVEIHKIN